MVSFGEIIRNVREKNPLIHSITNYVTITECANVLLAVGASPVMADDPKETADITGISDGLNLNIGTLKSWSVDAMLIAGKRANELGRPVVLDPVGAGSSAFRTKTAFKLLEEIRFSVIRGNISEIRTLASGIGTTRGVDAAAADRVRGSDLNENVLFAKDFARRTGAVIVLTGPVDIVTDGNTACCIRNGDPMMSKVSGTGCMLSCITAACAAANPGHLLEAAAAAAAIMGLAGEIARSTMSDSDGNASFGRYLIDAVYNMTPEVLESGARYEVR